MTSQVVVVGGGIAGLAAAHELGRAGTRVTVIDAAAAVGGKLRVSDVGGVAVDEGAEAFLRRRPEALALVAELGLSDELVTPQTLAASVWARGRLRPMPAGTVMGVPSNPAGLRGVLSAMEVARARADSWLPGVPPEVDVSVGGWVAQRLGRAVVDRLVDPMLGGVYAGRADELSLAATLPQLPRDERSALRAARRAIAAAPSADEPVFATLRGGMGALPTALERSITAQGNEIVTARAARRLERTATGWRVVHGPTTDERVVDADAVVIAVPPAAAARLLAAVSPAAAAELGSIASASMAIVTTAWRAADATATAPGSGYLVPAVYRRPVKAVTLSSSKWGHLNGGVAIARCSIGRYGDITDLQRDDDDLIASATSELTTYAGFVGAPIDARVSRWGGALPQYAVGHRERVDRIRAAVDVVPGLAVCGAAYEGVGIPACIATARQAVERVRGYLMSRETQ
ncbi:MAG TPA: protoporphyrinogen oxidase [Mycobacteriales bacterium]|nr:protoporphyrinogen oxidase [Mycobacteriales bacterium]